MNNEKRRVGRPTSKFPTKVQKSVRVLPVNVKIIVEDFGKFQIGFDKMLNNYLDKRSKTIKKKVSKFIKKNN